MITLVIPGKVQPKQRPRVTKRGTYTPKETLQYAQHVKEHAIVQYGYAPLQNALRVRITVTRPFLKSWSKKKKEDAFAGKVRPTTKPDVDNYAKSILDALNGITWVDDSQVVSLTIEKRYGEVEGAIIEIEEYR